MTDKKPIANDGYQPLKKGYQPKPAKAPIGHEERGGYQPTTSQAKPKPPPKKP